MEMLHNGRILNRSRWSSHLSPISSMYKAEIKWQKLCWRARLCKFGPATAAPTRGPCSKGYDLGAWHWPWLRFPNSKTAQTGRAKDE